MGSYVLVTGGAGYIATHTVVELVAAGYQPVLLDNLSNSKREAVRRVEQITGQSLPFHEVDIRDRAGLSAVFAQYPFQSVIHFAGLKAVGESVSQPLRYYENNVSGTIILCEVMAEAGVRQLVFSSSATVYGDPASVPIREDFPVGATTNPYGRSKYIVERILEDLASADKLSPSAPAGGTMGKEPMSQRLPTEASAKEGANEPTQKITDRFPQRGLGGENWRIALLRYFNPVGAHPSGLIGEDPRDIPNNLMPFVAQVAVGKRPQLSVFGNDYATPDGTGVRDYIHVVDLAQGHVAALRYLGNELSPSAPAGGTMGKEPTQNITDNFPQRGLGGEDTGDVTIVNLGTGRGYSVLEMIGAFEKASGRKVPYQIVARRPGDIASCYADPSRARELFGWQATRGIEEMCLDTWRWQQQNPDGY
jgi:UDP-glucose 4-epimerase